jgi:DNA (cytosine-5)-methyltransferase 3A
LYFEFLRAIDESGIPDFMLENVIMRWDFENRITNDLGVQPIKIDSQLVSAQLRYRNYWASFPITQPKQTNITLRDVLHDDSDWIDLRKYKVNKTPSRDYMWGFGVYGKCPNITNRNKSWCLTTKQDRAPNAGLIEFEDYCRYLTPIECERLQTLSDNYTAGLTDTRRYAVLGNCWTIEVIKHIFNCYRLSKAWQQLENVKVAESV